MSTFFELGQSLAPCVPAPLVKAAGGWASLGKGLGKTLGWGAGLGALGLGANKMVGTPIQDEHALPANWNEPKTPGSETPHFSNAQLGEVAGRNAQIFQGASRGLQSAIDQAWQSGDYDKAINLSGHYHAGRFQQQGDTWVQPQNAEGFFHRIGRAVAPNFVAPHPPSAEEARNNMGAATGALDQRYQTAMGNFKRTPDLIRNRVQTLQQQLASGGLVGPDRQLAQSNLANMQATLQRALAANSSKQLDDINAIRTQHGLGGGAAAPAATPAPPQPALLPLYMQGQASSSPQPAGPRP